MAAGLVAQTLNRPGRNLTGITCSTAALGPKRLQLLKEAVGTAERVAVVWWPREPANQAEWEALQAAAPGLGVRLVPAPIQSAEELEPAFAAARQGGDALIVVASILTNNNAARPRITELVARHRLPAMYPFREFVQAGGLMAYGTNLPGMFRRAATHMDKVLRGVKPGEVPIEQPTTFDFSINLKTAQALGLTIPESILQQATELIQ